MKLLVDGLKSRSETTTDLLTNICKGFWHALTETSVITSQGSRIQSKIRKLKRKGTSGGKDNATGKMPKPSWL